MVGLSISVIYSQISHTNDILWVFVINFITLPFSSHPHKPVLPVGKGIQSPLYLEKPQESLRPKLKQMPMILYHGNESYKDNMKQFRIALCPQKSLLPVTQCTTSMAPN